MSLISADNLHKIYGMDGAETHALRGVSFSVERGNFVAITGPSGSGKSTLLHILGFLDTPSKGRYSFDGKQMAQYSEEEQAHIRNQQMGFVFQSFNLLSRASVFENVRLPLIYSQIPEYEWQDRVEEAVASVGLSDRMTHEPSQLSGGERQRVAIARALVTEPQVIFADEPTGNLDSVSGGIIMNTLQELNEQKNHTILLITHETYTAEYAERIIHLRDGAIESDSSVSSRRVAKEDFIK